MRSKCDEPLRQECDEPLKLILINHQQGKFRRGVTQAARRLHVGYNCSLRAAYVLFSTPFSDMPTQLLRGTYCHLRGFKRRRRQFNSTQTTLRRVHFVGYSLSTSKMIVLYKVQPTWLGVQSFRPHVDYNSQDCVRKEQAAVRRLHYVECSSQATVRRVQFVGYTTQGVVCRLHYVDCQYVVLYVELKVHLRAL